VQHSNAKLTPAGRRRLIGLVLDARAPTARKGRRVRCRGVLLFAVCCGVVLGVADDAFTTTSRIDVMASPCGTNSAAGEIDCGSTALNDGQHVWTSAADSFGLASGNQDEGFYLALIG